MTHLGRSPPLNERQGRRPRQWDHPVLEALLLEPRSTRAGASAPAMALRRSPRSRSSSSTNSGRSSTLPPTASLPSRPAPLRLADTASALGPNCAYAPYAGRYAIAYRPERRLGQRPPRHGRRPGSIPSGQSDPTFAPTAVGPGRSGSGRRQGASRRCRDSGRLSTSRLAQR